MTRRRSGVPGRHRAGRRPSPSTLLLIALFAAACGGTSASGSAPSDGPSPAISTPSAEAPTLDPASAAPATAEPTFEPSAAPTEANTPEPSATSGGGPAGACTGTDNNREFYDQVATAVAWTVYCPVLARGWFVDSGRFALASGGWLEISYRGPAGARLELREGVFCDEDDGCVPSGQDVGPTPFGDLDGTLVALDDGGYVVVVDRGASPTWILTLTGADEATARAIAADLVVVD